MLKQAQQPNPMLAIWYAPPSTVGGHRTHLPRPYASDTCLDQCTNQKYGVGSLGRCRAAHARKYCSNHMQETSQQIEQRLHGVPNPLQIQKSEGAPAIKGLALPQA